MRAACCRFPRSPEVIAPTVRYLNMRVMCVDVSDMVDQDDFHDSGEAHLRTLSQATIERILGVLAPGSSLNLVRLMKGSLSNFTHLVEATTASGELVRLVVRRYSSIYGAPSQKARVEYNALHLLNANDQPVPTPLYLDEKGAAMGAPGIVTSFLQGSHMVSPLSQKSWATGLAETLASIHSISCEGPEVAFLLDADSVAAHFLDSETIPESLASHPDGAAVWDTVRSLRESVGRVSHGLVHTDFWMGNVLWHRNEISGVIDWEVAAYGDPAIDVAYCRMDMCMVGMDEAADHFLKSYEAATDRRVKNLELWELVVAAGVMADPARWLPFWRALGNTWSTPDTVRRNLRRFVADAQRRKRTFYPSGRVGAKNESCPKTGPRHGQAPGRRR